MNFRAFLSDKAGEESLTEERQARDKELRRDITSLARSVKLVSMLGAWTINDKYWQCETSEPESQKFLLI